jgi:hypothetical protein
VINLGNYWLVDPDSTALPFWPMFAGEQGKVMELDLSARALPLADQARLERIDHVYATARFVDNNFYAVLAAAIVALILTLALLLRLPLRLARRFSSRRAVAD